MGVNMKIIKEILIYFISVGCMALCVFLYKARQELFSSGELQAAMGEEEIYDVNARSHRYQNKMENLLSSMESALNEAQSEADHLRERYDLLVMLEEKENQAAREISPDIMYEKYFRLREGEMARLTGAEDADIIPVESRLNSHFSFFIFEIRPDMWVQYADSVSIYEDGLPTGILIESSEVDLGFMDARAGMNFEEIQENACESEIQTGFIYAAELEVYYIKYEDEGYIYNYISLYEDGTNSWLEIYKK